MIYIKDCPICGKRCGLFPGGSDHRERGYCFRFGRTWIRRSGIVYARKKGERDRNGLKVSETLPKVYDGQGVFDFGKYREYD